MANISSDPGGDRLLLSHATMIIMRELNLSEPKAYQRLRHVASARNVKKETIAAEVCLLHSRLMAGIVGRDGEESRKIANMSNPKMAARELREIGAEA
jgi:hypothetical protein